MGIYGINVILIVETFLAFVVAVTIHEAAHAGMAALLGDSAPVAAGRLSLSPRRQMAAIGTIVAIVFAYGSGGLASAGFGWGRPVDVDARRLRVGPNFGLILVALTGPVVNAVLGVAVLFGLRAMPNYDRIAGADSGCLLQVGQNVQQCLRGIQPAYLLRIEQFLLVFALANLVLALLNLIPLHPLDGYKILFALLPTGPALRFRSWEPYMELLLLVIFFVLPLVFAFVHIQFAPAQLFFIGPAQSIAGQIAGNLQIFLLNL